jgi:Flp pilus assembly pilin Flp
MFRIKRIAQEVQRELVEEHQGAVAFEYVIILVIMAVAIFTAWGFLADEVVKKAQEIALFIQNNGQNPLGTGAP